MKSDNWFVRIQKVLTPLVLYLAITLVVEIVGMVLASFFIQMEYGTAVINNYDLYYQYLMEYVNRWALGMTGIAACICLPILIWMYRRDQKRLVIPQPEMSPVSYVYITFLGMCACFLLNGILSVSGLAELLSEGYEQTAESIYTQQLWMQYLVAAVIIPCMEELIFRGLIFRRMRTYAIFSLAALISAVLFGIYHMNLLQFIYATCLGLLLAYVYEQFRTILAPILLHAAANAFSILITTNEAVAELISGTEKRLIIALLVSLVGTVLCIYLIWRSAHSQKEVNME
jgi:membrane protease YdiL (CAAX protease family)